MYMVKREESYEVVAKSILGDWVAVKRDSRKLSPN